VRLLTEQDIEMVLKVSDSIILSTVLLPDELPGAEWWYYGLEHGQHVAFYSKRTMEYIAGEHHLNYYPCGSLNLLTPRRLDRRKLRLIARMPPAAIDAWTRWSMPSRTASDMHTIVSRIKLGQMK
jgi:hypothetical protein